MQKSKKSELKVGDLVRVKTLKEIKTLRKNPHNEDEYSCSVAKDSIVDIMHQVLGTICKIHSVSGSISGNIKLETPLHEPHQFNYYANWLNKIDTKAARVLFKGN